MTTAKSIATATTSVAVHHSGYAVDIRIFLAALTIVMTVSFIAGVSLGIPNLKPMPWMAGSALVPSFQQQQEVEHLPAGQHLLIDMEYVDADFLNSEERLTAAMVETITLSGLTMLSYHCHSLLSTGVSCVGVLLESHISFHTWPNDGVIALDLFTCGSSPLLPVIPVLERLFGVGDNVRNKWSHELRGFRTNEQKKKNYLDGSSDLTSWVLSPMEMHTKRSIYSNLTSIQRVDIWDIVQAFNTSSHAVTQQHNLSLSDARLLTPELVTPDRLLFLDGTLQSLALSERIYHEVMVHPAMFAHPHPEHIVILGGGAEASLREVLKHKTIKSVTMLEIDQELVDIATLHLPQFSNCSDLVGRAELCFDDDLVEMQFGDGFQWFIDRFGINSTIEPKQPVMDVIFLDAVDLGEDVEIAQKLSSLMNSLAADGILAIRVGSAATIDESRTDKEVYENREKIFTVLEELGSVAAMLVYEDANCGFHEPRSFLIVCKDVACRSRWYARNDAGEYQIYDRIVRTHSKERALMYYDGTTQFSYQWPKKGWETVYCSREPRPWECTYVSLNASAQIFDINLDDEDESAFRIEVKLDDDDETITSVFATVDIPMGSFIMPEHLASSLELTTKNLRSLSNNADVGAAIIEDLLDYFDDYAHESLVEGSQKNYVEVGASCLIRRVTETDAVNVGRWMPGHPSGKRPVYSPVYERNRISFDVFMVATRHIHPGEEIVMHKDTWRYER